MECTCYETPREQQFVYFGITEPGSALEPNPDCPQHFPQPFTIEHSVLYEPGDQILVFGFPGVFEQYYRDTHAVIRDNRTGEKVHVSLSAVSRG